MGEKDQDSVFLDRMKRLFLQKTPKVSVIKQGMLTISILLEKELKKKAESEKLWILFIFSFSKRECRVT